MKSNSFLSYPHLVLCLLTLYHSSTFLLSILVLRRMSVNTLTLNPVFLSARSGSIHFGAIRGARINLCVDENHTNVIQQSIRDVSPYLTGIYVYSNGDDRKDDDVKEETKSEPEATPEEPKEEQVQETQHTRSRIRADERTDDEFGRYRDPIRPPDSHYYPSPVSRRSHSNTLTRDPFLIIMILGRIVYCWLL